MNLTLISNSLVSRRNLALLAPENCNPKRFTNVTSDWKSYSTFLAEAQKLRGKCYVEMGALDASQLTADGRQLSDVDHRCWHLLTLGERGQVLGCLRYLPHSRAVSFSDLIVARSALAKSERWGQHLRAAVAGELGRAKRLGCSYVEIGGWAIAEALRCTTEAVRMIVSAYAMAQLSGGALGLTTASLRSCSASILRRIGGRKLGVDGVELPSYSDAQYNSTEVEILGFDSSSLHVHYRKWMEESMSHLTQVPVILRTSDEPRVSRTGLSQPALCLAT
jgi:hypothetical protein